MNATPLCLALHFCDEYEVNPERSEISVGEFKLDHAPFPETAPTITKDSMRESDSSHREGLLKVVQLTDAHLDHKYATVSSCSISF